MSIGWAQTWQCACGFENSSGRCFVCGDPAPEADGSAPVQVAAPAPPPPPAPVQVAAPAPPPPPADEMAFRVRRVPSTTAPPLPAPSAPRAGPASAPAPEPEPPAPVFTSSTRRATARVEPEEPPPSSAVALLAVAGFIGTNFFLSGVVYSMHKGGSREPAEILRIAILAGIAMQLAGGVVASYLVVQRLMRPAWRRGMPLLAGAGGVLVGLVVAQLMESASRSVSDQPYVEPGVAVILGDGRAGRLAVAILAVAVLAPLIEELFFRGFLSESVRRSLGPWAAAVISSGAFSVAHLRFNIGSLVYFFIAGMMMWTVYTKGGLLASIGTHAAFNGSLVIFTVLSLNGPPRIVERAGVSVSVPGGWFQVDGDTPSAPGSQVDGVLFAGPALAQFGVISISLPPQAEGLSLEGMQELATTGAAPLGPEGEIIEGSIGIVTLPYGDALKMHVRADGQEGAVFQLLRDGKLWIIVASSGGSPEALVDAETMLATLEFDAPAPALGTTPTIPVPRPPATRASCGTACDLAIVSA